MSAAQNRGAGDRLLQAYLDALLPPGGAELPAPESVEPGPELALRPEPAETPAQQAAAVRRFWLVSAGGLELALPATEVQPIADVEDCRSVGPMPVEVVDLGRVVGGRAGCAEPSSRRACLRVPAFPGRVLQVQCVHGLIDVPDRAIRWRKRLQPHPWLAGMMDSPAAAVLSVHRLVQFGNDSDVAADR